MEVKGKYGCVFISAELGRASRDGFIMLSVFFLLLGSISISSGVRDTRRDESNVRDKTDEGKRIG